MEKLDNYIPWENGYYEHGESYKKSDGTLVFTATHYFSGKAEQIESRFPIDCDKLNKEIRDKCNDKKT